jgi:hypothetical protein
MKYSFKVDWSSMGTISRIISNIDKNNKKFVSFVYSFEM